jgi:hypothetical protein
LSRTPLVPLALLAVTACALPRSPELGLALSLGAVEIPAGSAHRVFQAGRPVGAASTLDPFCELEIATVSEQPQQVAPVRARVTRVSQALLKDPITRIPALIGGIDCSEPVFRETIWWLAADRSSPILWLRCLAPYFDCRIGGPLSPAQVQAVMGPALQLGPGPSPPPALR